MVGFQSEVNTPLISVLLPFNREDQYLFEAINSCLNQTYGNIELILLDSSGNEWSPSEQMCNILSSDARVRHIKIGSKMNLSQALNIGIDISRGPYIARMDADDINFRERFEEQIKFMESNPKISVLGTGIEIIKDIQEHKLSNRQVLLGPNRETDFARYAVDKNPIFHPTAMIRREVLLVFKYNRKFKLAQDYELWIRVMRHHKLANLQRALLFYRLHEKQSGVVNSSASAYYATLAQVKHCITMIMSVNFQSYFVKALLRKVIRLVPLFLKSRNWALFLPRR